MAALAILPALATLPVLAACGREAPPEWHDAGDHRWRELRPVEAEGPGFTRVPASRTGIRFQNSITEEQMLRNQHLFLGSGVAIGDADGDGRADIYLARLDGPNELYLNRGGWRFREAAAERGVEAPGRFSTGAVFADVDGDGDLDLLVTALGGPNALFVNDGTGRFEDRTARAGLASERGSTTATLADVEGDGDLDLYIVNYKVLSTLDEHPPWERTFDDIVRRTEEGGWEVAPEWREDYRVLVLPEHGRVVRIQRAEPDWFYLNDGTGRFERVPWTSGRFRDADGEPLERVPDYFGLTARFYDVDRDGDPDLYVCDDFEDPDQFWINDGDGNFRAAPDLALRTTSNAAMAVDFADIDRDGDVDFFELDMLARDPLRRATQRPSHTALPKLPGQIANRPQLQRNTLFMNRGDGTFAQIGEYAGVTASEWSWSALFLDVDLDGYEDLLVGNGNVLDVQDVDADLRVRAAGRNADRSTDEWRRQRFLYPELHTRNLAFRNGGDLTFREMGGTWGFGEEPDVSSGMATGDLDGDGDLDVVVNRLGFPAAVYRNDAAAPRVAVHLAGRPPNTRGIGARVRLLGGPVPAQEREMTAGGLYLSGPEPLLTFAAGEADSLSIRVAWRSGRVSALDGVRPNRIYEIREPPPAGEERETLGGEIPEEETLEGGTVEEEARGGETLFRDVSELLGHVHRDSLFDDFRRQPLLPNRLSQLGPGLSWLDADGDGDEDLAVPSGRGGRLALFENRDGAFRRRSLGPVAAGDQTAVLAAPGPSGSVRLLVGQASYEMDPPASTTIPGVVSVPAAGGGATPVLPGDTSSVGPLALADVDLDGDLDLFVGGRVIPGTYPVAATSRLLRNEGGRWVPDEAAARVLGRVGLVSAATFSDLDLDGDPDLLLALEWGSLKLLRNEGGRFLEADVGLDSLTSRWNGVTTGDLDGDGRPDIVATSWGRNTKYDWRDPSPVSVFYGYFDGNRSLDVVEGRRGERGGREGVYPLDHPLRLLAGLPVLRRRFDSLEAVARATVPEIVGRELSEVPERRAAGFDHLLLLNRGDRFEPRPLPTLAQLAPAFHAGVADLDGDGREDLFLAQNFFPTADGTPRWDAGRGLVLRGDGAGGLEPVPGQVSGIRVYGDQRGAAFADFDGDGRLDVAVSQNAAETKLYRNVGATPGLRVRLAGPPANPHGIGAALRLVYGDPDAPDRLGPAREVAAGTGYWSAHGPVQVLGGRRGATAVRVRWPGGGTATVPVPEGALEVTLRAPDSTPPRRGGPGEGDEAEP